MISTNLLWIALVIFASAWLYLRRGDVRRSVGGVQLVMELARVSPTFVLWISSARVKQVVRSMATGSTTVIAAVLAVVPPYVQLTFTGSLSAPEAVWTGLALGLVTAVIAGVWSLRRLPPPDYAQIVVGGQTASDTLTAIAYEMLRLSRQFTSDVDQKALTAAGGEVLRAGTADGLRGRFTGAGVKRLRRKTSRLAAVMLGQQHQIQRILEMKQIAARALAIREQRLCDHVFCFSPTVFDNRIRKYVDNWEDVIALGTSEIDSTLFKSRVEALLAENRRICAQVDRRVRHLHELVRHRDLHIFVHACASERSATSCLKNYAEALSSVGMTAHRRSERSRGGFRANHRMYRTVCQRLRFLLRVQRAHPGFDLHLTCRRATSVALALAKEALETPRQPGEVVTNDELTRRSQTVIALERREGLLFRLEQHRYRRTVGLGDSRPQDEWARDLFSRDSAVAEKELQALGRLFEDVTALVEKSRKEIVSHFRHAYDAYWREDSPGGVIVVTHGYSKTVREVLQHVFARADTGGAVRLYMLTDGSSDAFDARLMEYELRHDDRTRRPVTSGTRRNLRALIAGEPTRVILLLGAESFDLDGRIVQSQGSVRKLVQSWRKAGIHLWVVAVAESFKMRPSLPADPVFYHDHLNRATLYTPRDVDTVVTDQAIVQAGKAYADGREPDIPEAQVTRARKSLEKDSGLGDGVVGPQPVH